MNNSCEITGKQWHEKIFNAAGDEEKEVLIRVVVNEGIDAWVDNACLVEMIRWQNKIIEKLRSGKDE